MNLEEIQPAIVQAITRIFEVQASGVPVLLDDGEYPKVEGREQYLREKGLCIIVRPVQFDELGDSVRGGLAVEDVVIDVVIEENAKVNRSESGTGVILEKALRVIREGIVGRPTVSAPNSPNTDAPWQPFIYDGFWGPKTTNGIRQAVVSFRTKSFINPRNKDPQ